MPVLQTTDGQRISPIIQHRTRFNHFSFGDPLFASYRLRSGELSKYSRIQESILFGARTNLILAAGYR
jgi:hypothetical protein